MHTHLYASAKRERVDGLMDSMSSHLGLNGLHTISIKGIDPTLRRMWLDSDGRPGVVGVSPRLELGSVVQRRALVKGPSSLSALCSFKLVWFCLPKPNQCPCKFVRK